MYAVYACGVTCGEHLFVGGGGDKNRMFQPVSESYFVTINVTGEMGPELFAMVLNVLHEL